MPARAMRRVGLAVTALVFFLAVTLAEEPEGDGEMGPPPTGKLEVSGAVMNAISIMLIGSITFQMSLFYLVNHSDSDIRYYSWLIIGTTISIFVAVLFYQAVIILAMGLTIGFCWEKCFDAAVENLAERSKMFVGEGNTTNLKLCGALFVCAWVTPAYRWYILPAVAKSKAAKDAENYNKWDEKKKTRAVRNFEEVHTKKKPGVPLDSWDSLHDQDKLAHNVKHEYGQENWLNLPTEDKLAHLENNTQMKIKGWAKINVKIEIGKHNSIGSQQPLLV